MAIYTLFTKRISKIQFSSKTVKLFAKLTQLGFGVYLTHALIIDILNLMHINICTYSTFLMIPLLTVVVYALSLIVTFLIRKIPHIGKIIT